MNENDKTEILEPVETPAENITEPSKDGRKCPKWLPPLVAAVCAVILVAAGIIGWVGLVVPHIARLLVGADFRRLLPASLLLGASFLLAADTLARTLAPIELPLGILTAFVGVPCFLLVLARSGGRA